MHQALSDLLAPHYCFSCGEIGRILCENCKYDIISEPYEQCLVCLRPAPVKSNLCTSCIRPYSKAWCIGEKQGVIEKLIDTYKFERTKDVHRTLGALFDDVLPYFPPDIIVVPVPTVAAHVRRRGYDHARLLAHELARLRGLEAQDVLRRQTTTTQRGSQKRARWSQAKEAFTCTRLQGGTYLLVDDVFTTGATIEYATRALLAAGATEVWVAIVGRQPLEK